MKLLDEKGLTTVWAAIKNTFTSKSDADGKYARKSEVLSSLVWEKRGSNLVLDIISGDGIHSSEFIPNASSTTNGAMSNTDKAKLDGIASGANNYSLPTASATTLGGIKTNYTPISGNFFFKVNTDTNGNARTYIPGLVYGNDEHLSKVEFLTDSKEYTSFDGTAFHFYDQEGTEKDEINLPNKSGTFALTSDLSDLCKFNFINSISECQNGKINFLYHNTNDNIDLNFLDNLQDGLILFIVSSVYGREASHSSSEWFYNTNSQQGDEHYTVSIKVGQVFLATKYNGQIHLFSLYK